jgi:hypothetical protein
MGPVKIISSGGEKVCEIAAPIFNAGTTRIGRLGFLQNDLIPILDRGEKDGFASFCGNVCGGMIMTRHIFRGLTRPLLTDDNTKADQKIHVYTWKPAVDWIWEGDKYAGKLVDVPPQAEGLVFAVIVSPNEKHKANFPEFDGWVSGWNWVDEDKGLKEAPQGWVDRFQEKLWTRA